MAFVNTAHSYGLLTKTFHWLTALLILTLIPLGIVANKLPYETSEQLAQKAWLFSLHKTLGVTMFFVALLRVLWALRQPKPGSLHPERKTENWLAETVHWLLYGSLVLVPLSGWIHHAATTGFAPIWWPLGQTLPFVPKDESIARLFSGLHIIFERVLILSLVLHVVGALKHHFVDKDTTLKRMWFRKVTLPDTQSAQSHALPLVSALFAWALALFVGSNLGLFAHPSDIPNTPELAAVQSDWVVQDGTLDIVVTQFGSPVQGRFEDWTASIQFDPVTGFGTTDVTIAIASLTLGSVTNQAMGPDFFDSSLFPTAQFQADISPIPDGYLAKGTLSIRDQSLPFELPFSMVIDGDTATMNTITYLDRRDFNVGNTMADESSLKFEVQVNINLTATRAAANES